MTIGSLPEELYSPRLPFADELTQSLAWVKALREIDREDLGLLAPGLLEISEDSSFMGFADSLSHLHHELTGEMLSFSRVLELSEEMPGFPERDRWKALIRLQLKYLSLLDAEGLWDLQTARLRAVENNECRSERDIILIGTADINGTMRAMLSSVSSSVTALVFAPEDHEHRFDALGCLLPGQWDQLPTTIPPDRFLIAGDPDDECALVLQTVASFKGDYSVDEITIGIPDESMAIPLRRAFQRHGVRLRRVIDRHLSQTTILDLLTGIADFMHKGDFVSVARLLRHSDISRWLSANDLSLEWLTELDDYFQQHLPIDLESWLGDLTHSNHVRAAVDKLNDLLAPLSGPAQLPDHWANAIADILQEVLQGRTYNRDILEQRRSIEALSMISTILASLTHAPAELVSTMPSHEAIRLVLRLADRQTITSPFDPEAIEQLGWLELPLDTAPAVIITSFNDGLVPQSVNAGLFLPDSFRKHLGINDNRRRFARDAYAICLLQESNRDVTYICRRREQNGDPLQPSRLALQMEGDGLAERILAFWTDAAPEPATPAPGTGASTQFVVPKPLSTPAPQSMSVTAFRDYINCPYRFYLGHVLRLRGADDAGSELDAPMFGNLLHDVLRDFGMSADKESTDPAVIRGFLNQQLSDLAASTFGPRPLATITVQLGQARLRLNAFAEWQASRSAEGWQIQGVEVSGPADEPNSYTPIAFTHDGVTLMLTGRIDRIDYHPDTHRWALLDYKAGDKAQSPAEVHLSGDLWVDLQLPLYRHLAPEMGVEGKADLGYILLPKDTTKTGVELAEWTEEQLLAADDTAVVVWKAVAAGDFWKPKPSPQYQKGFEQICQQNVFEPRLET
jgi:RecB family exonuclease